MISVYFNSIENFCSVLHLHLPEDLIFLLQLAYPRVQYLDPALQLLHVLLLLPTGLLGADLILDLPPDLLQRPLLALGQRKALRNGVALGDQRSLLLLGENYCWKRKR